MRNHTAKPFDYKCVGFQGNNRVFVKDNHGTITKVNRKDVTPVEMDIKIAELFNESRQNSKIRDVQLAISHSTQTSCSHCYTANNEQNSFLITDNSPQSCHKQAVEKYITNLPMEINMKILISDFPEHIQQIMP